MDALQQLTEQIEQCRAALTPGQLKKLRKKRAKLVQQVCECAAAAAVHVTGGVGLGVLTSRRRRHCSL
jgi:hypothetical protein